MQGTAEGFKKLFLNPKRLGLLRKLPINDDLRATHLAWRRRFRLGRLAEAFFGRHDGRPKEFFAASVKVSLHKLNAQQAFKFTREFPSVRQKSHTKKNKIPARI
jgi:hypothetical protein